MKKLLSSVAIFLTVSMSANALIHVEPYLGYKLGSGEDSVAPITEYDFKTTTLGARLGVTTLGFMGGIDYSLASGDWESTTGSTTTKVDSSQKMFGLFAGYEFPILLRAWATYFMDVKQEVKSGANNGDEYKGNGIGLGVGYTGLPFVSLNLEYRSYSYDERDNADGSKTTLSGSSAIDNTEYILSVSLPLDL